MLELVVSVLGYHGGVNISIFVHSVRVFVVSALMVHQRGLILMIYIHLFFSQVVFIILSFYFFPVKSNMGVLQRIQLTLSKDSVSHRCLSVEIHVITISHAHLPNDLTFHLVHLQESLRSVGVELLLQNSLNFLLYFLLINLSQLLLFHLELLVGRRLNFSHLESNPADLYDVAFH